MDKFSAIRETLNQFLSNPTWDILLLLFFFAAVFTYGLMVGRNKIIVLLLASYPAALISEYLSFYPEKFLTNLNTAQLLFFRSFTFFILFLFIFWILNKSGFSRKSINKKTGQVLFLSFLNVGLWANIIFGYVLSLSAEVIKLAPISQLLFSSNPAHLIWLTLPILVLYWLEKN